MAGGELWVLIADSGCGIHAGRESDGLGLGLAMIAKLTDGFSVVERSSGGTELRLRFVLDASKSGS
jgi:two-component sensor histidine kinase